MSASICERCGATATGWDLWDYCALCSSNLCDSCMEHGCCGSIPAVSGLEEDNRAAEEDEEF